MNHSVSGETHESYIVSADWTDSTRISLPADPQFQVPKTPCARCEPWWGDTPGRSLPPIPAPPFRPGSPLLPEVGKPSSSSHRCKLGRGGGDVAAHGLLCPWRASGAFFRPPRGLPRAPGCVILLLEPSLPGHQPFWTMWPRSRQSHYCAEKPQSWLWLCVLFSVSQIQTLPPRTSLQRPRIQARFSDAGTP